jgi:death-on-curing protein
MNDTVYLALEQVLFIHDQVINETGGTFGLRDLGALHAAVERPKASFAGTEAYPDIFAKAAALLESLCNNHPVLDGNKRVTYVATGLLLELNGYELIASRRAAEPFMLKVAQGRVSLPQSQTWLRKHTKKLRSR